MMDAQSEFSPQRELKNKKIEIFVYIVLYSITAYTLAIKIMQGIVPHIFNCLWVAFLIALPMLVRWIFKISLPTAVEIFVVLFAFAAFYLGEMNSFYSKVHAWDSVMHFLSGIVCTGFGLGFLEIINRKKGGIKAMSPILILLFIFCFSMSCSVVWEFVEYGFDKCFGIDMQKDTILHSVHSYKLGHHGEIGWVNEVNGITIDGVALDGAKTTYKGGYIDIGLEDTMKDMLLNFVGTILYMIPAVPYVLSNRKKMKFIEHVIPYKIKQK